MSNYSYIAQKQRGIYSEILNPDNSSVYNVFKIFYKKFKKDTNK